MTFDLRSAIREVLDDTDLSDPGEVAEEVFSRTPKSQYAAAYRQSLRVMVRQVISEVRRPTTVADLPVPTPQEAAAARKKSARSHKVAAIRAYALKALRDRVHVEDGWKTLSECTAVDLRFAAEEREELAQRNLAKARQYHQLADLLLAHGVETVGALPEAVLSDTLVQAA